MPCREDASMKIPDGLPDHPAVHQIAVTPHIALKFLHVITQIQAEVTGGFTA
jgi:hypothetical protein